MSAPFIHHSLQPQAIKDSYSEFDVVSFVATFPNRMMVGNTIRLVGDLEVLVGSNRVSVNDKVYLDPTIGYHSFIDNISTESQAVGGQIENLGSGYQRLVGMTEDITTNALDMISSQDACEGKAVLKEQTLLNMTAELPDVSDNTALELDDLTSFSIKPMFCLNATSPAGPNDDTTLSFKKTGALTINFTLARNQHAFETSATDVSYKLHNLRLEFISVPESGKSNKTLHRIKYHIKSSVLSAQSNVSTKVPAVCSGVSCSFIQQNHENDQTQNSFAREVFPLMKSVEYLFNNNTNEHIAYRLTSRPEIIMRYIDSIKDTGHNRMELANLNVDSFGIGLTFQELIDLRQQLFNINLRSDATDLNNNPLSIHLYFHSFLEL